MNQVYYNQSMLLKALLPMVLIAVSALYVLLDGAANIRRTFLFGVLDSPYLFYPVLMVIFISFGQYSWLSLRKVLRRNPAICWGDGGMTLANGSRVAWAAIETISVMPSTKPTHVLLFLDQPLAFMDMQVGKRRHDAQSCYKRHHTPVAIDCTELNINAPDLCAALRQQHQRARQRAQSQPSTHGSPAP